MQNKIRKKNNFILRLAKDHDLENVLLLENSDKAIPSWNKAAFAEEIAKKNCFLLEKMPERISAGVLVFSTCLETAEILNIIVGNKYRRQGLGKWMIDVCIEICRFRQAKEIVLEVRNSNLEAQAFYQQSGFINIACRKDYYHFPTEPAVIYKLLI
jgi:ribosomal-protein-alanine N-acetyltransferase